MQDHDRFYYNIFAIMEEIPAGCVAAYGQLARLAGQPKHARLVGRALHEAGYYGDFPCHRVVGHNGRLAPDFEEQRSLLEAEGVTFLKNGNVDMKKHQWKE